MDNSNSNSNQPDFEPLTRTQILVVMGVTAVILLIVAKVWQYLGEITLLDLAVTPNAFVVGYGLDYNEKGRNLDAIYQIKI